MNYSIPKFDDVGGKWVVNVYYDDGNLKEALEFDNEDIAYEKRDVLMGKDTKKEVKQEKKDIEKKSTFLENLVKEDEDEDIILKDNVFGDLADDDLEDKLKEHKTEFEKEEKKCQEEARGLLIQVARVYLDGEFIEKSEYLKFKMQLESKGLAGLVFQLNITRKAVFRLSEKIHTDEATPRHFEVLTGMNRVILDITKYQHEHLSKLEASMKKFSVDAETDKSMKKSESENDIIDAEGTVIDTRSRKELLGELNGIIEEAKQTKTPESRNTRLQNDDDDDVEKVTHQKYEEENTEDLGDVENQGGLNTWKNEDDEEPAGGSKDS